MKKKKLFLGLAIASAALFSLAACNNGSTTPSVSSSQPAASSSQPAASSSQQAAADYTATFVAVVDGVRNNDLLSKTATSSNGKFARPADTEMAKDGYEFQGFYTSGALSTEFNFDSTVSANTTIYCKYHKMTVYDTLKADADHLVTNYDFAAGTTATVDTEMKFNATAPRLTIASNDDVEINGTGYVKTNAMLVDFGRKITTSGVYKIYFEVEFDGIQGESFAQINGSTDGTEYKRVFEIRTDSTKFGYSFDGSTKIASNVAAAAATKYAVYIELDTANGTVTATVDGTKICDAVKTSIKAVNGLKFQSKSAGTSKKKIDNLAVTFTEAAKSELALAKEAAIAALDAKTLSTDTDIKAAEQQKIAAAKTAIDAAETVEAVTTAKNTAITYIDATKYILTVKAYSAADTAVSTLNDVKFVVADGETYTDRFTTINYTGYVLEAVYTDAALTTECTGAALTANTTAYAKVRTATKATLTYTPVAPAEGNEWPSAGDFRENQADGKENESGHEPTGTYNALQITLKTSDNKNHYIQTPTLTDCKTSATVKIQGWTAGSGDAKDYVLITAYNAAGEVIGTKNAYTSKNKQKGNFSADAAGNETDIVITASENIAYLKISCRTDTKSFYVTSLTVEYDK